MCKSGQWLLEELLEERVSHLHFHMTFVTSITCQSRDLDLLHGVL